MHPFLNATRRRCRSSVATVSAALFSVALLAAQPASAAITVFLDYNNFGTRLDELATAAGINAFQPAEVTQFRTNILAGVQSAYTGFDISFTETAPLAGNFETIRFGTTNANLDVLGTSQQLDFRNLNKNNIAQVFTRNFDPFVDEFDGLVQRNLQISQLSTALWSTAAHELGHNLGLEHCDCYGDRHITPANYGNTQRIQNTHIMATGISGANEIEREKVRTFNTLETAKLEYAEGLLATTPAALAEQGAAHGTLVTAQSVSFSSLTLSDVDAFTVLGGISAAGELDLYSFTASAGSIFTAHAISSSLTFRYGDVVNSNVALLDSLGNIILQNFTISLGPTTYAAGTVYSSDGMVIHVPIATTGTYYVQVGSGGGDPTGSYELFAYVTAAAPEPGVLSLLWFGGALGLARVRRQGRSEP